MDGQYNIPVVLFVFRRLDTLKLIFDVFRQVKPTKLYIFADGARDGNELEKEQVNKVREYVDSAITWDCAVYKNYSPVNKGCAPNICDGITDVFRTEESAVIFEDDAVPTEAFFYYCEELLTKYKDEPRIQFIAGFNGVGDDDVMAYDYSFARFAPKSGAIALWADRWNNCDFSMSTWPQNKQSKSLKKYFYYNELYSRFVKIYDDSYKGVNQGWDYQMDHDLLDKGQFAIVPKGNLVKSYGNAEGAFHPQEKKWGMRFARYMDYSNHRLSFPMKGPGMVENNNTHDRLRQKSLLDIEGNYIYRHLHYFYRDIKDFAYDNLPPSIWKVLKRLIFPTKK